MQEKRSVSEVARELGVPPRVLSDLFYARKLDDERCPIVGGRRLIPADYIPMIAAVIRDLKQTGADQPVEGA
jgi:hypothetical protein